MRHHDGLSFREAAAILGISENTATARFARALRQRTSELQQVPHHCMGEVT